MKICALRLQPVARYLPSGENRTQQTTLLCVKVCTRPTSKRGLVLGLYMTLQSSFFAGGALGSASPPSLADWADVAPSGGALPDSARGTLREALDVDSGGVLWGCSCMDSGGLASSSSLRSRDEVGLGARRFGSRSSGRRRSASEGTGGAPLAVLVRLAGCQAASPETEDIAGNMRSRSSRSYAWPAGGIT